MMVTSAISDKRNNVLFHGIGTPGRALDPGEEPFWVSTSRFLEILDDLTTWPDTRISFDDSNTSDLEIALPALQERGLRADFFVIAGRLGQPGSLSADDVRELARQGMTIGSHGMHHRPWRGLDPATTEEEFGRAREQLAAVVSAPIELAACPLGAYDRRCLTALRHHGYARVFTSDRRPARPGAFLQPRYSVRHDDTHSSMRIDILGRRSPGRQARSIAVGLVKRWR